MYKGAYDAALGEPPKAIALALHVQMKCRNLDQASNLPDSIKLVRPMTCC